VEKLPVLAVEDEIGIQILVQDALEEAGFEVQTARNGDEALALIDGQDRPFAGIVTDIRMPGTLEGWDVARHAREADPSVAIVYISADSGADWLVHGVPDSIFLQKPFAASQVITALTGLLNKSDRGGMP